jgi:hypothetical protein
MKLKPTILLGRSVPSLSIIAHYTITTPKVLALAIFTLLYALAILYCRHAYYRDPTSYFFDPVHGYDKKYSVTREEQALNFIESANALNEVHSPPAEPKLCLGVATVARPDKQYIASTIGSLLDGLTLSERRDIHFIFFIAHTQPSVHPISGEKWVKVLPDTLLQYPNNDKEVKKIRGWEEERDYKSKGLYDYAYLLEQCYDTGASYIAMIEGDVLAVKGWYERAITAAESVDDHGGGQWLYIRMFYTETYLGWNSEEWPAYLGYSFALFTVVTTAVIVGRQFSKRLQREVSNVTLGVISLVILPACIMLYFFAGRTSMQPPTPGVHRMDNFGCCSQGFIFSRQMVPLILDKIRHPVQSYIDMLMEAVAVSEDLARWVSFQAYYSILEGRVRRVMRLRIRGRR